MGRIITPKIFSSHTGLVSMNIIQNSVMFGGVVMYIILLGTVWNDLNRGLNHVGKLLKF